ncbi:MAG: HAMP domain-containing histidine kinase, partial [Bacteroidota bacterium]|nr:HAMP domain-containing histidine kinase [Bacteroidota bacterium]
QVAHEIKNPLTPMKLSIQFLQKAIHNNQPNVKDLTTSVTNTLVEQIDHLSKIAADFARFAHIGNLKTEVFDLHKVLDNLKELFGSNPNVEFHWFRLAHPVIVKADKTHMNRLFTNLITNSIDACSGNENCRIEIREDLIKDDILIQIKDNGEGIEEEMQSKIFTPNFTTKTSGTGLGLAMCKSIVEQADGEIWFKTTPGEGTCFYVQLPLHTT